MQLYPTIVSYLKEAEKEIDFIPAERKDALEKLTAFVKERTGAGKPSYLVFICTHNSRRSHTAQLWAAAAAAYYSIDHVETYSGGTEVTAFHQNAIKALSNAGFHIMPAKNGENPVYNVKLGDHLPIIRSFSKKFMDTPNPQADFAAIMTCSSADRGCPFVPGATARIAIPYNDPKASDGTPQQEQVYAERGKNIAVEMLYVFSGIRKS
ncbi:low molecular weight phosphatase family protein [Filimonas effusa]|uniref:Protein-tyrosine-phosphatase n=1 Tax=Filimonas effusa TaxID=2508721 RepID=A0A4Q1D5R6_9BACT|nr:protein-tyrosine-phosphatase [Filimonas effusa]RXK83001.1 protein-tyrosine-phosphatase [Filimonas effusa]